MKKFVNVEVFELSNIKNLYVRVKFECSKI